MSGSTFFWENIIASAQQGCITNMYQASGIALVAGQWHSTLIGHILFCIWQVECYFWVRIQR